MSSSLLVPCSQFPRSIRDMATSRPRRRGAGDADGVLAGRRAGGTTVLATQRLRPAFEAEIERYDWVVTLHAELRADRDSIVGNR